MRKASKALWLPVLLAGIAVAGCNDSNPVHTGANDVPAAVEFTKGQPVKAAFTDARAAGMKGVAENERLRLFVDEKTGVIAVLNKQSGEIWYSNPPERDKDPLASGVNKGILSSQLKIDYYNNFGQVNSINTFTDSVSHKQIKFEPIPHGVKVTYQFGTAVKSAADLPMMLSSERIEAMLGKLDKTGQRALKIAYKEDPDKKVYVRNDSALNGLQLDRAFKAFEDAGYTEEDLKKDMEELQFTQEKPEPRIFLASIEYALDGGSLIAKIPASGIQYPSAYPIGNISFLSFFGAGGSKEQGAIFVPDGSGALIRFNNGKKQYPAYQQPVYGEDLTMKTIEDAKTEQAVRLPVFGIIRESGAILGIIEEGASAATIHADISGKLNSYNYVYPSFNVVNKGDVVLQANGQERTLPRFQERPTKSDFTVRYAFLNKEEASYHGLARYYRRYLEEHGGLPKPKPAAEAANMPFYLQLVGGIAKEKHFAGIPYRTIEPLTTFEQSQDIINQMKNRNISNIKLKFSGWFNGGMDHEVPDHVSVDKAVGGSKGLQNFITFTREQEVSFYPDVAVLTANTGKGFNENANAARTLRGVPAALYPLDQALNRRDRDKQPSYVVSPRLTLSYAESVLKGLKEYRPGGISLRDLADQLSSDYRKHNQLDRTESESLSIQALGRFSQANPKVMADGGNVYALPFLSDITNAPMSGSHFKIEDEEIPFYQMVIRGYVDYTGSPFNLSTFTDERQYILKCLEYGAGVYFEWIHEPNDKVKDTEYNDLYAVHYKQWIDQAAEMYREVNDVLKNVRNEPITGHEKLGEGVYKTVYGNGFYVIVNYNRTDVTADGRTVKAESYLTGGVQS
ncbi:DUF5696 domain-containing protein [Paenibacillus sp. VCA1]|uniref:DUF5696 domain-containing protein n=1 Tax=Paenibacillus sp. VCA1 TaxID=3039148 RepID=UPI002871BE81|nr:DUF5696 domain-containing protein [Paenibacillus sp. VCA1]MDR9855163.1 DUF5696 domain-containing protein [Paenibacillus sp. VCA1]